MADNHTLLLLRHAKAAWPDGVADVQRPLAERGRRDAGAAGRELRQDGPIALVVRSPAVRVAQTWQEVCGQLAEPPTSRIDERLYGGPTSQLLPLIAELPEPAATVLLVGHNPDLSWLATVLSSVELELRTASIVRLELTGRWADVAPAAAALGRFVTPRAL
jgi:phosphohistidine phosphatase